ncbi:MAG: Gfo/Idh/MocA family oxidoreductase [Planctomycetales bacterium]|nr:Gfo/Idh/MocA family oxidoreductase [Planctomycetales bacterium]
MARFSSSAAVVGTGFIGPVHVEGLRRAGVAITGIVGSTPKKSAAAADRLGLPRGYASLDEALQDPVVTAVHLASPNRLHYAQVLQCLSAGKHVLCEKPLAMTPRESAELVEHAQASGLVTGVAYNIRSYPLCVEARERVRGGDLGRVLHVTGSYVQDWLLYERDFNWRVLADEGGALRAVADIGTHWLDLAQSITGLRVVSVCADLATVHGRRLRPIGGSETFATATGDDPPKTEPVEVATEDCGGILLRFDNGASGCMWVSQTTAGRKNCLRLEIAGAASSLAWNSESPNSLWIGLRERANELLIRDPALLSPAAAGGADYPGGHNEGFPDTFKQLFRSFYAYIEAGDLSAPAPFPTFADGHRELRICEAVLTSHRQRRWVDVEP